MKPKPFFTWSILIFLVFSNLYGTPGQLPADASWEGDSRQSPDSAAEYTFSSANGSYEEISGGSLSTASGDDGAENIELPFAFTYDSLVYTKARISVNGWLELDRSYSGPGYGNELASQEMRPMLAPFWDDLYDDGTSEIRYQTLGSTPTRVFVVQWKDVHWTSSVGALLNFQLRLYEDTNLVEFVYGSMNYQSSSSASIGINDQVGGSGHFLSVTPGNPPTVSSTSANNNIASVNNLPSGTTYAFTPPCFHLWNGSADSNWYNASNWNCATVPGSTSNASLPSGTPHCPELTSDVSLAVLGIEQGTCLSLNGGNLDAFSVKIKGTLTVTGSETITIRGLTDGWDREPDTGIFNPANGTVVINGSGLLTLDNHETFHHLTIESGKAFNPESYQLTVNGTFTNRGTYWPSLDIDQGGIFLGAVENWGTWRATEGVQTINGDLTNQVGATFNTSNEQTKGTILNGAMLNLGTFNASSSGKLSVNGSWTNNGTFSPGSGTVILGGLGEHLLQAGSGVLNFYHLSVAAGSVATPLDDLQIQGNLVIQSGGELNLGENNLSVEGSLTNSGTFSQQKIVLENPNTTRLLNIRNQAGDNIKYRGVDITPDGTGLGLTRVTILGEQAQCNEGDELIHRCFQIEPASLEQANIRFWYLNAEKGGEIPSSMKVYHWDNPLWQELTLAAVPRGTEGNYEWVEAVEVSAYDKFGLADGDPQGPTALRLADFQGQSVVKFPVSLLIILCISLGIILGISLLFRKRWFRKNYGDH